MTRANSPTLKVRPTPPEAQQAAQEKVAAEQAAQEQVAAQQAAQAQIAAEQAASEARS